MTITTSRSPAGPGDSMEPGEDFDRASWRESAACRDTDTEMFFPISSVGAGAAQAERAKEICARCPVREACLDYALGTRQVYGIWGGRDEDERRALRRRKLRAARAAVRPERRAAGA